MTQEMLVPQDTTALYLSVDSRYVLDDSKGISVDVI
jgi:hypothetical protein